ncbi:MAG: hypothetical protein ACI9MC_003918, partial [Kiritimatiellia bacterium]
TVAWNLATLPLFTSEWMKRTHGSAVNGAVDGGVRGFARLTLF